MIVLPCLGLPDDDGYAHQFARRIVTTDSSRDVADGRIHEGSGQGRRTACNRWIETIGDSSHDARNARGARGPLDCPRHDAALARPTKARLDRLHCHRTACRSVSCLLPLLLRRDEAGIEKQCGVGCAARLLETSLVLQLEASAVGEEGRHRPRWTLLDRVAFRRRQGDAEVLKHLQDEILLECEELLEVRLTGEPGAGGLCRLYESDARA